MAKHILLLQVCVPCGNTWANKWCIFGQSNNLFEDVFATIGSKPLVNMKKGLNSVCGLDNGLL